MEATAIAEASLVEGEAAIAHYAGIFPTAQVDGVLRHESGGGARPGSVHHAQFRLFGETLMAMDSALDHHFGFTESNTFLVLCEDQREIDRYCEALAAVPEAERCGWLGDRSGMS